jgi:hypothetical protein
VPVRAETKVKSKYEALSSKECEEGRKGSRWARSPGTADPSQGMWPRGATCPGGGVDSLGARRMSRILRPIARVPGGRSGGISVGSGGLAGSRATESGTVLTGSRQPPDTWAPRSPRSRSDLAEQSPASSVGFRSQLYRHCSDKSVGTTKAALSKSERVGISTTRSPRLVFQVAQG